MMQEILKMIPIILIGNLLGSTILSCMVPADSALIAKSIALTEPKIIPHSPNANNTCNI